MSTFFHKINLLTNFNIFIKYSTHKSNNTQNIPGYKVKEETVAFHVISLGYLWYQNHKRTEKEKKIKEQSYAMHINANILY